MFPDASDGSFSPDALLQYGTDQLYTLLLPMILGIREKYYETYIDYDYSSNTPTLTIPSRSIGGTVSAVQFFYGVNVTNLVPIDPAQISTTVPNICPANFYFENNSIVFYPPPTGAYGVVRIRYFQRPSRLAKTTDCAQITAIDRNTGIITAGCPATWTNAGLYDFIPQDAAQATPFGIDSVATNVTTTAITFPTAEIPTSLAVGDWIALAGFTPIPEVPFEFQTILTQAAAVRALGANKDVKGKELAQQDLAQYMQMGAKLLTPRDQQGGKRIVSQWRSF